MWRLASEVYNKEDMFTHIISAVLAPVEIVGDARGVLGSLADQRVVGDEEDRAVDGGRLEPQHVEQQFHVLGLFYVSEGDKGMECSRISATTRYVPVFGIVSAIIWSWPVFSNCWWN